MKKSKVKIYEKMLKQDNDFDYAYLLIIERFKIKRMIKSFIEASCPHEGIEYTIRELKWCVKLIDIVLEEDAITKTYMEQFGQNQLEIYDGIVVLKKDIEYKIPIHINKNNAYRFNKMWNKDTLNNNILMEVRRVKALYLYNKIRNRMLKWWW